MWTKQEIEAISKDTKHQKQLADTFEQQRDRQTSWADIIRQDPELIAHYGIEQ